MSSPDFWADQAVAREKSEKAAALRGELKSWDDLLSELDQLEEMAKVSVEDSGMQTEITAALTKLEEKFGTLEFATLFQGEYDEHHAVVAIHAGAGGTDSQDWVGMLLRMYLRFAERHNFQTAIVDDHKGQEAGYKTVTFTVKGRWAYGYFKSEAGVHRLVRISPFDAEKMRHTSFALVEVLPELEAIEEMAIDPKDLRVDTFMSGGHGGQSVNTTYSAIRVVHIPTGITVSCQNERSQMQNKETALKILQSKLHHLALEERQEEKQELRGAYQSAEWGNQARSYVLQPYRLVKDHRTKVESSDTDAVLDGKLEPFMEGYLKSQLTRNS